MNILKLIALVQTKPKTTIAYRIGRKNTYYDHAPCALEYLSKPTRDFINWRRVRIARCREFDPQYFCSSCDAPLGGPRAPIFPEPE